MFTIHEYLDKFKIYELRDEDAKSWFKVAPERGGIIFSLGVNGEELLYLDQATFNDPMINVRGGIPILFPICGPVQNDQYTWRGNQYQLKQHGFARNLPWEVIKTATTETALIELRLTSNDQTKEMYPFDFELRFTYSLKGNQLSIEQTYHNRSSEKMPFYAGFHPYFKVGDKRQVRYGTTSTSCIDYTDFQVKPFTADFDLSNEPEARMILNHSRSEFTLEDRLLKRTIRLNYSPEFKYPVFWSVVGKNFICAEPFMAKKNALNTGEDVQLIKPGEVFTAFLQISREL